MNRPSAALFFCVAMFSQAKPVAADDFVFMNNHGEENAVRVDFAYTPGDPPGGGQAFNAFQLLFSGRYMVARGNKWVGGYVSLPFAHLNAENNSAWATGGLEMGASVATSWQGFDWVTKLGLVLPTASEGGDKSAANFYGGMTRPHQAIVTAPDVFGVRAWASPVFRTERLFAQIDAGLDLALSGDVGTDCLISLNAGLGIYLADKTWSVGPEFMNTLGFCGDGGNAGDDTTRSSIGLTAWYRGSLDVSMGILTPLDETISDTSKITFGFGIRTGLPGGK